jgi:hypothetical protein
MNTDKTSSHSRQMLNYNIFPGYSRATRSPLSTHIWYIISVKKAARLYEGEGMRGNAEWVEGKG